LHDISPGQQIINRHIRILGEAIRENGQYVVKPGFRVQSVGFGGFQHSEYSHTGVRPGLGIAEQPVLTADHDRTAGVLHLVIFSP